MGYNKQLFEIVGHRNLEQIFGDLENEAFNRIVRRAFARGGNVVKKSMIREIPSKIKPIKKAIKVRASRRELVTTIGVNSKMGFYVNRRGIMWDPWMLAYWFNYGTYGNRSLLHRFANPRRFKTRHITGGIKPDYFIERGWENSSKQAQEEVEKTWEKEVNNFFEKHAYK
jgi:hypothetical protein